MNRAQVVMVGLSALLATALGGCVPAAFMAGASVGLVAYDQRSAKTIAVDKNTALVVQKRLNDDEELYRSGHVTVAVFNGVMLLAGQTPTEELRSRAEDIARQHAKVKLVYNEISIGPPVSDKTRNYDTWITAKVRGSLVMTHGLNSSTIKVVTEDGVVFLMGTTTKQQGQIAALKAQKISGVKKVVKLFEYIT